MWTIRPGRIVSIVVVATWAVLLTVHLSRSYESAGTATLVDLSTSATSPAEAELTQRGVYYRGARIGFIRERLTPTSDGYRAEQIGELVLKLLGREREVRIEGSADTGSGGALNAFQFRLTTSSGRSPFETTVLGTVEGDTLHLSIDSSGSERKESRKLDHPIVLPLNLYYSLSSRGWTPGETYRVRLFDPMTLSEGEAAVEVREPEIVRWGGREEEAYRLVTTFAGLDTTAWVNERGEVLQEETPLGWTLVKEAPGSAFREDDAAEAPDVLVQSAVPAIGYAGESSELRAATLSLLNFPDKFDALVGGRQIGSLEELTVVREEPPYELEGASSEPLEPSERREALASDAFIQSDDPEIVAKAKELTDGLDAAGKAEALTTWVHQSLAKSPTLSIPSAREVLTQRVGDCNEHTVLYAALARAAGLPTRVSTGLAYTGGQFYYHAWPEVWLGRWVAVDPTFGQFPADPLHVRLLTGGLESQYEVLELLERGVSIEVLKTE